MFHHVPLQASAVAVCTVLFLTVAVGSQLAFGPDVPADVLTQFNAGRTLRLFVKLHVRMQGSGLLHQKDTTRAPQPAGRSLVDAAVSLRASF